MNHGEVQRMLDDITESDLDFMDGFPCTIFGCDGMMTKEDGSVVCSSCGNTYVKL